MERIAQAWIERELRGAAGWFGFAVAALPVVDRLDDAGWITTLASGSLDAGEGGLAALGWSAFFVALGIAAAQLLRRHAPRHRWWFFAACATPLVVYAVVTGPRVSAAVSALGFAVAALRLRAAQAHATLPPDVVRSARYAGGSGDVLPPS